MNILANQFKQILDAHRDDGAIVTIVYKTDKFWYISLNIGKCEFILSSSRDPIRRFRSLDTAQLFVSNFLETDQFFVSKSQ